MRQPPHYVRCIDSISEGSLSHQTHIVCTLVNTNSQHQQFLQLRTPSESCAQGAATLLEYKCIESAFPEMSAGALYQLSVTPMGAKNNNVQIFTICPSGTLSQSWRHIKYARFGWNHLSTDLKDGFQNEAGTYPIHFLRSGPCT